MIVIELLRRDFQRNDGDEGFVRSYATRDDLPESGDNERSKRVSVLHLVNPGVDQFHEVRLLMASMQFKEVLVVLQLDRSDPRWRDIRDAVVRIKKYMSLEIIQSFGNDPLGYEQLLEVCGIDFQGVIPGAEIEIKTDDVRAMFSAIRDPARKMAIARTEYYRTPNAEPAIGRLRDLQHLNLLEYLEDMLGIPMRFSEDHSLIEIGPGAGFIYRYAQTRGLHEITAIDKNEAFCGLASIDGVPRVLNSDLTDTRFCADLSEACPDGASYFFAKGVLNVYSFSDLEQYRAVVEQMSGLARSVGIWITYNVDRINGHRPELIKESNAILENAGWTRVEIPTSYRRLIGIDYPPEVDSGFWVLDRIRSVSD